MSYRSSLEARIAKKTTKAIVDFNLIEDGDRVMLAEGPSVGTRVVTTGAEEVYGTEVGVESE